MTSPLLPLLPLAAPSRKVRARTLGLAPAVVLTACAFLGPSGCGGAVADVQGADAGPPNGSSGDGGRDARGGGDSSTIDATFPPYDAGEPFPFDATCSTPSLALTRVPVSLLFAIDGSASISDSTLASIASALDDTLDAIAKSNDWSLEVGLYVFGDSNDESCLVGGPCDGPYPGLSDVGIARVGSAQHDALRARIDGSRAGGTASDPLFAAVKGGISALSARGGVRKGLFLVTGGFPTDGSAQATLDAVIQARAKEADLRVIVAGVGPFPSTTTYDPILLGHIAEAGGLAPSVCDPLETATRSNTCYAQVDGANVVDDLAAAIHRARGAMTCSLPIPAPLNDPNRYNVVLGGKVIPMDPSNGWTFDGTMTNVVLHGATCDAYVEDGGVQASLIEGCVDVAR